MLSKKMLCCVPVVLLVLNEGLPSVARGAEPELPPPSMRGPGAGDPESFEDERPGGGRRFGERRRRPTYESLSDEVKLELEEFMEEHFAEQYDELARLEKEAPEAFDRKVNRVLPQMLRLMRLERDDPRTFPLRVEEVRVSTQIRGVARRVAGDTEGEADADQVARLRALLEQRFDLRQKIHRNEVKRLERRLAKARERLDRNAESKEEIITRELEEMLTGRPEVRRTGHRRGRPVRPGESGP